MQWLDTIATKTAGLRQVAGVHLSLTREGAREVCFVVLKRQKQQLVLVEKGAMSWEAFLQQHKREIPLALSVDGKGMLTKEVASGLEPSLQEVLPNATEDEFYYNSLPGASVAWVSLMRRAALDELLAALHQSGIALATIQLGPLSLSNLLPLLAERSQLRIPNWQLELQDGQLAKLSPLPAEPSNYYQLGEDSLAAEYLQPYANALAMLAELSPYRENNLADRQLEWLHKRLYSRLGIGVLGFFFLLLLVNFGINSSLSSSQQELNAKLQQHQHLLGRLEQLQKQEASRAQLLQAIPLKNQTLLAYHADLLAATVPSGIRLDALVLHPQEGKKNKQQALHFLHGQIELRGQCSNPVLLNRWLEALEKQPWVKAVKNQRYTSGTLGQAASTFSFTLETAMP